MVYRFLVLFTLLFSFSSCTSNLPIDTYLIHQLNGDRWELYTNDPIYYNSYYMDMDGYCSYANVNFIINKLSGSDSVGSGVYFSASMSGGYDHILFLLLNTKGEYALYENALIGETDYHITLVNWTHSDYMVEGYNVENAVHIKYNEISEQYELRINGQLEMILRTSDMLLPFVGGEQGPYFQIGNEDEELFPNNPFHLYLQTIYE